MKRLRTIELLTTEYLVVTVVVLSFLVVLLISTSLYFQWATLEQLDKFVGVVFKMIVVLAGVAWTLNRYYVQRTDFEQLRVDADVDLVEFQSESEQNLLIFRLDVVNTGKSMLSGYDQALVIESVTPGSTEPQYTQLHRWPETGFHSGSPIEPGSWAAINDAVTVAVDVRAVRIYIELKLGESKNWTWHKTFSLTTKD